MLHIDPKETPVAQVHRYLLGGIAPRPIALVSTLSEEGFPNLAPFSFFNMFGANPPTVGFSPSSRVRDGSRKDTYHNIVATGECVIQAVTYAMVEQVSLASTEYPSGVDEFVKSGLTPLPSEVVKPPRVAESPFQMECRLRQMVSLGDGKGSGNLAICEVVRMHIDEDILDGDLITPDAIDLVGRNSADFYTRASGAAIFHVAKPVGAGGIGFDRLPEFVRGSDILSANNLAQLANYPAMPSDSEVEAFACEFSGSTGSLAAFHRYERRGAFREMFGEAVGLARLGHPLSAALFEMTARTALAHDNPEFAWKVLLYSHRAAGTGR